MVEVEPQLCSDKEIKPKPEPKPKSKSNLLMKPQIPVLKISISLFSSSVLFLSIFIIVSLFFFHLSTNSYNLFKNTKFWFFISNVIVVIIAADSGAFSSSSKLENDLYEEFLKNSKTKSTSATTTSSFIAKSPNKAVPHDDQADGLSNTTLDKKPILQSDESAIGKAAPKILCKTNSENRPEITQEKEIFEARYHRSNSEKTISSVVNEDRRILNRSETEKSESRLVEENEFSSMSDEELNKRVEEFIDRFNRQIRLQESRNFDGSF